MHKSFSLSQTAHAHAPSSQQITSGDGSPSLMPPPFQLQVSPVSPPPDDTARNGMMPTSDPSTRSPMASTGKTIETGPPSLDQDFRSTSPVKSEAEGGVVQRMVNPATIPSKEGLSLPKLEKYIYGTLVNKRGQTFEMALEWSKMGRFYLEGIEKLLQEAKSDARAIPATLMKITDAIQAVNSEEAFNPSHPNGVFGRKKKPVKEALEHESPFTISKTPESQEIAEEARKLLGNQLDLKGEKFMLGVLVLPSNQVILGVSQKGRNWVGKVQALIGQLESLSGRALYNNRIYSPVDIPPGDFKAYAKEAKRKMEGPKQGKGLYYQQDDRIVKDVEQGHGKESKAIGANIGKCAAPVVISMAKAAKEEEYRGGEILGLTEVWITNDVNSQVKIVNSETGGVGSYPNKLTKSVPSCHVCNMQLDLVAKEVIAKERNSRFWSLLDQKNKLEREINAMTPSGAKEEKSKASRPTASSKQGAPQLTNQRKTAKAEVDPLEVALNKMKKERESLLSTQKKISGFKADLQELNELRPSAWPCFCPDQKTQKRYQSRLEAIHASPWYKKIEINQLHAHLGKDLLTREKGNEKGLKTVGDKIKKKEAELKKKQAKLKADSKLEGSSGTNGGNQSDPNGKNEKEENSPAKVKTQNAKSPKGKQTELELKQEELRRINLRIEGLSEGMEALKLNCS